MKWNGRSYRPVAPSFKVYVNNTSRPSSDSTSRPKKLPVWRTVMSVQPQTTTPVVSPSPTPTSTVTPTPSQTPGVSPSPTSSVTPTVTPTSTITPTPTVTSSPTPTVTPTNTVTPTPSSSPLPAGWAEADTYLAAVQTAGGTINGTITTATRNYFNTLFTQNLWNGIVGLYPMLGGVSGSIGINAKNPGTYNITWYGGITFSSNGIQGNGTTGYGNTGILPSALDNTPAINVYNRTSSARNEILVGQTGDNNSSFFNPRSTTSNRVNGTVKGGVSYWLAPIPTITGSLDVTGSVTIANAGDLTMYGHKMFNVGAFLSTQTQSGSANVSQSINYNTTDYSQGVSVVSGTRLTVANAGVYNIQFSAQVDRVSGSGTDTVHIWLKKNGTNVTNSAGAITISGGAAAAKTISSWNYVVDAAASDYYEICWQTTDANIQLINAAASGNIPDVPSVIVTVTQVR